MKIFVTGGAGFIGRHLIQSLSSKDHQITVFDNLTNSSEDKISHLLDDSVHFIKGDITQTVPRYLKTHPQLKISLLNLDTDIYEPAVTILENLYPRIVKGGVLILDDYGNFPGETKAVDDYFKNKNVEIRKFPFAMTPSYIIK